MGVAAPAAAASPQPVSIAASTSCEMKVAWGWKNLDDLAVVKALEILF